MFIDIRLIGRTDFEYPEEISIINDSLFHISTATTSLLKVRHGSQFTQLPNGDWLVCGGSTITRITDEYMLFKHGPNKWTKVGTMRRARWHHASVYIDGALLTTGGLDSSQNVISHHEHFSFEGGNRIAINFKKRKELPIALYRHSATIFGTNKMLITGGFDAQVRNHIMSHIDKINCINIFISVFLRYQIDLRSYSSINYLNEPSYMI